MSDIIQHPDTVPLKTYYENEGIINGGVSVSSEESHNVSITTDEGTITPVYVKNYGGDSYGKHSTLNDGCGNTRTRSGGTTGFQITMEGIMTIDQLRSVDEYGIHKGAQITIDMQPWTRTYICDNFTWDKPNDLNKWVSPQYTDGIEAFTFQLKTKGEASRS